MNVAGLSIEMFISSLKYRNILALLYRFPSKRVVSKFLKQLSMIEVDIGLNLALISVVRAA